VLALVGLVVVVVLELCIFVYKYSVKCDSDRLFVCLWCIGCVRISANTALSDRTISRK
jgi:hypothetical protein